MNDNWISVKDRLPVEMGNYRVRYSNGNEENDIGFCQEKGFYYGTDRLDHVTHWMPLPSPPVTPKP